MLFNQMKNYKGFTAIKELWLTTLFLLSMFMLSFSVSAANNEASINNNELIGISYNTIQSDQIVLVFSFTENITSLPIVKTSMTPAFVEVTFDANTFGKDIKETLVNYAGVKEINLDAMTGKVVALISLEKLAVFDVSLNNDKEFAIS
ncbi:MAG: type IV pilus secretin PilQ, partial [Colwellia sp.]